MTKNNHRSGSSVNKKRKILLSTLIPLALIIIALSIFFGFHFYKKPNSGGGVDPTPPPVPPPTPPPTVRADITQSTIDENNSEYKVAAGTPIWYDRNLSVKLGHCLFNLDKWCADHPNITTIKVGGSINFGFLVDFGMDCHLVGVNNEIAVLNSTTDNACGVIVGKLTHPPPDNQWQPAYWKNMNIESSMTFDISSNSATSNNTYGVFINKAGSSSTEIINATFHITSSTTNSNQSSYGAYFQTIESDSSQTINGVFSIFSFNDTTYGVYFQTIESDSSQTINGVFTIFCNNTPNVYGCVIGTFSGNINIGGVFTICSEVFGSESYGITFDSFSGSATISGVFTVRSVTSAYDYSVYFRNNDTYVSGSLTMTSAQFFSNQSDGAFTRLPSGTTYKWNGDVITKNSDTDPTNSDDYLILTSIKDDESTPHFLIKVIDDAIEANKITFNTTYKNALESYVATCGDSIAKPWLESIISKIPLS